MNTNFFLTPKQQFFCDQYLIHRNATHAALQAGYSSATALNGQLMQLPKIKLYLQDRMAEASAKLSISHDTVLRELSKVALANMGNYFGDDGKVKPLNELSADDMAAVQSIVISPDGMVKINLCSKMAALEKMAKHLNFYNPSVTEQKPVYLFLSEADITADDSFDDHLLQQQVYDERKKKKKAEDRRLKLEAIQQEAERKKLEAEQEVETKKLEAIEQEAERGKLEAIGQETESEQQESVEEKINDNPEAGTGTACAQEEPDEQSQEPKEENNNDDCGEFYLSSNPADYDKDGFLLYDRRGNRVDREYWFALIDSES